MAFTVGKYGLGSLVHLIFLIGSVYVVSALFIVVVLGLIGRWIGFSLFKFLRYLRDETAYHHAAVDGPRPDTPVLIRGLVTAAAPATTDVWIVPVRDRGGFVVSIVEVPISSQDGQGFALAARGWNGDFPAVSDADARQIGSIRSYAVISAVLRWAPEYAVAPGGATAPFWLLTLSTGDRVVVTEDRTALRAP